MPFIKKDRREIIDVKGVQGLAESGLTIEVGDLCYVHYKPMVQKWKANPRWTTAHEIYRELVLIRHSIDSYMNNIINDDLAARELAWQVFFIKYVWPYEQKKIKENGDI